MLLIGWIISVIISGLVIGALGRLAIPGPNPMSIGLTIAIGIGGSILGGIVGALLQAGWLLTVILEVAAAALIVFLLQRSRSTI
ncbi:MAG: GlsB/YeaQ/YmgE family stress response membrane protein [Acidimicrobiales bacterium]